MDHLNRPLTSLVGPFRATFAIELEPETPESNPINASVLTGTHVFEAAVR